jgi:hypothetical protein
MMAKAPVGRRLTGTVRKDHSRAGAFAYFAAKLNGWKQVEYNDRFRDDLGISFNESETRASARALRQELQPRAPDRDWLLIDGDALGLETVLITFPASGGDRSELINALSTVEGICQLVQGEATGTIVAVAVVRDRAERQDLRARVRDLTTDAFTFEPVLSETHEPAKRTWRALARREANAEGQAAQPAANGMKDRRSSVAPQRDNWPPAGCQLSS